MSHPSRLGKDSMRNKGMSESKINVTKIFRKDPQQETDKKKKKKLVVF